MASWPLAALAALVAVGSKQASAGAVLTVAECQAVVRAQPRSLEGYECLLSHRFTAREEGPAARGAAPSTELDAISTVKSRTGALDVVR